VAAFVVEAIGVALLLYGLLGDPGAASATATVLGFGTLLMIFGFALLAPTLVRPLSGLIGRPLARFQGLTGMLARENSRRQPQRTAVTASALMIGVALVVLVAIFAAGLRATIDQGIDEQVKAVSIVTHDDGFSPLPADITKPIEQVEGVTAVSRIRFATGRVAGETGNTTVTGIDPDTAGDVITLKWDEGSDSVLSGLGTTGVAVPREFADKHDLKVGSSLELTAPRGNEVTYRVRGIYEPGAGVIGGVLASNASLEDDWDAKDIAFVLVAGDDPEAVKKGEDAALTGFPAAKPQTIEGFKDEQNKQVDALVGLVYALLSLSVIVALLGIVNTLALSVHERTRELGLLRAVGMSRRQVRRMVRAESVITAAIGAVLGIVLGVALAAIVSRPLAQDGFVFEIPVGTLITVVILASIMGVLAAIPPARRASKVDVLRAVTTE
jgi:putative ABC transport system permease protein